MGFYEEKLGEINTLIMSDDEICRSYRLAKDKLQQIGILAQMCLCGVGEIVKILRENGVYESSEKNDRTVKRMEKSERWKS